MNTKIATLATVLAVSLGAFGTAAHADEADGSQFATPIHSVATRAQVQQELAQYKQAGVNPWSTSYNPLRSFQSTKTAAQVRADYVNNRAEAQAMNSEDSGSAYLSAQGPVEDTGTKFAGQASNNAY